MAAYYNEFDPYAAEWLRRLILMGHIAEGEVDDRSITEVQPDDLRGFTQCHFFAGIGVWSHALRLAGWPDNRPVWTGSCPCQPFSAAGKRQGEEDERHLWPEFHRLIRECRPAVVFGEQVASKDGLQWLDTVCADMEGAGYAIGAADLCAAGIGAPHIRQRLWFVGERLDDATGARHERSLAGSEGETRDEARLRVSGAGSGLVGLGDTNSPRHEGHGLQPLLGSGEGREPLRGVTGSGSIDGVEHAARNGRHEWRPEPSGRGAAGGRGEGGVADTGRELQEAERREPQEGGQQLGAAPRYRGRGGFDGLANAEHDDRRAVEPGWRPEGRTADARGSADGGLADTRSDGSQGRVSGGPDEGRPDFDGQAGRDGADLGVANAARIGERADQLGQDRLDRQFMARPEQGRDSRHDGETVERPSPTNGHWRAADWLFCRDGKWRPVEPGTFPLAHGAPARVGRLRAYGNAIVPQAAAEVISAFMEYADAPLSHS